MPSLDTVNVVAVPSTLADASTAPSGLSSRSTRMSLPGSGFDSEARITPLLYLFDPMRFGAESYRHFRKEGNGEAFVRKILAGGALRD